MNAHQNNKDNKRQRNSNKHSDIDKAALVAQLVIGAASLVLVVLTTVYYFSPFNLS